MSHFMTKKPLFRHRPFHYIGCACPCDVGHLGNDNEWVFKEGASWGTCKNNGHEECSTTKAMIWRARTHTHKIYEGTLLKQRKVFVLDGKVWGRPVDPN